MSIKSIPGSAALGQKIKSRRNELGLTIEDAASKSSVGTKTWCRYENGESIRTDKAAGICKTLKWKSLPDIDHSSDQFDIDKYKRRDTWSDYIAETFGDLAAVSFIIGSDILFDNIKFDLDELSKMPKGTHIGQLDFSYIIDCMPEQFLMNYDYELLYRMKCSLLRYFEFAKSGTEFKAHTVLDEILLYCIMEESKYLMEETVLPYLPDNLSEEAELWESWVFDLFDDMDVVTFLYSDFYLTEEFAYHFSNWLKHQFY